MCIFESNIYISLLEFTLLQFASFIFKMSFSHTVYTEDIAYINTIVFRYYYYEGYSYNYYEYHGLDENYCRNPDGDTGLWCYIDNGYELCDVPTCNSCKEFYHWSRFTVYTFFHINILVLY